jgi:hypothetical protein
VPGQRSALSVNDFNVVGDPITAGNGVIYVLEV